MRPLLSTASAIQLKCNESTSINQSVGRLIDWSDQSINQLINQSIKQTINQSNQSNKSIQQGSQSDSSVCQRKETCENEEREIKVNC